MRHFDFVPRLSIAVPSISLVTALAVACTGEQGPPGAQGPSGASGEPASTNLDDLPELVAAWRATAATARYVDVNRALEGGYVSTEECVESPAGVMGVHYINLDLIMDPGLDPAKPEVLLYANSNGGARLVAVEYLAPIGPPGAPVPNPAPPAPRLFGQTFDGPMAGHGPGDPPHYDLHVWLWKDNPDGIFAGFNPDLKCHD